MAEDELANGEELIDERGRNATQQEIDEEGASQQTVDVPWPGEE